MQTPGNDQALTYQHKTFFIHLQRNGLHCLIREDILINTNLPPMLFLPHTTMSVPMFIPCWEQESLSYSAMDSRTLQYRQVQSRLATGACYDEGKWGRVAVSLAAIHPVHACPDPSTIEASVGMNLMFSCFGPP